MISSDNRRYAYGKSQLIEVICQLRFPTILSIDTREPADFQETVRAAFPRYQCQVEKLPGVNGAPARTVNNHTFISEDGGYKLSLTKDFIALSGYKNGCYYNRRWCKLSPMAVFFTDIILLSP